MACNLKMKLVTIKLNNLAFKFIGSFLKSCKNQLINDELLLKNISLLIIYYATDESEF